MLVAWMVDNNSQDWSIGIIFVQFHKNTAHHAGIKCSPYSAMFGAEARIGLTSSSLPGEVIERLESEDDLTTDAEIIPADDAAEVAQPTTPVPDATQPIELVPDNVSLPTTTM